MPLATPLGATVFAAALALGGLAVVLAAQELPSFWDPCKTWGFGGTGSNGTHSGTLSLSPGNACRGKSATSETKPQAVLRLAAVDGTGVVAAVLAGTAAWSRGWKRALAAAVLMAGESVLLFLGLSIGFVVAVAAALLFLAAALRWRPRPPRPVASIPSNG